MRYEISRSQDVYALFLSFVPKKREKNSRFFRVTYSQSSLV